jgi:hypothetical protein
MQKYLAFLFSSLMKLFLGTRGVVCMHVCMSNPSGITSKRKPRPREARGFFFLPGLTKRLA